MAIQQLWDLLAASQVDYPFALLNKTWLLSQLEEPSEEDTTSTAAAVAETVSNDTKWTKLSHDASPSASPLTPSPSMPMADIHAHCPIIEDSKEQRNPLTLAVDASIWLFQAGAKENSQAALRILFFRLCRLISLGMDAIFVFDGPHRPPFKRKHRTTTSETSLSPSEKIPTLFLEHQLDAINRTFAELVRAFGFRVLVAQSEAEAECAHLQHLGFVDAVLTDDNDALVFGASVLIRTWQSTASQRQRSSTAKRARLSAAKNGMDHARVFTQSTVRSATGLTPSRMRLLALFCESDYSSGVRGMGTKTAAELVTSADYAERFEAIVEKHRQTLGVHGLTLEEQGQASREVMPLLHEMNATLHRKAAKTDTTMPRLSRSHPSLWIPTDGSFPSWPILNAYWYPMVYSPIQLQQWQREQPAGELNIRWIRFWCRHNLHWTETYWTGRLHATVLPAVRQRWIRQFAWQLDASTLVSGEGFLKKVVQKRTRLGQQELLAQWNIRHPAWVHWLSEFVPAENPMAPEVTTEDAKLLELLEQEVAVEVDTPKSEASEDDRTTTDFFWSSSPQREVIILNSDNDNDDDDSYGADEGMRTPPPLPEHPRIPDAPKKQRIEQPIVGVAARQPQLTHQDFILPNTPIEDWYPEALLQSGYPRLYQKFYQQQQLASSGKRKRRKSIDPGLDPKQRKLDSFWTKKARANPSSVVSKQ